MGQLVRAVLFNLDNTLAERAVAFQTWSIWFARERLMIVDTTAIEGIVAEMIVLDSGGRTAIEIVFRVLKERYPQLGESVEHLISEFREEMITHLPPLDPGAARLLDALDVSNLPCGIASNGSPTQVHKVRALGL